MIGGPARLLGDHTLKPHSMQVERLDKRIDHMDRVVLAYPILQTFRQERQLGSVRAFNEASHPYPPSGNGGILADSWLFTQPGSLTDASAGTARSTAPTPISSLPAPPDSRERPRASPPSSCRP